MHTSLNKFKSSLQLLTPDFLAQRCLGRFKDRTPGANRESGLIHRSLIVPLIVHVTKMRETTKNLI